jgi:hypothetical protein
MSTWGSAVQRISSNGAARRAPTALLLSVAVAVSLAGCTKSARTTNAYNALSRGDFNRFAVRENLPLYWIADTDQDHAVDPDEVADLLFYPGATAWTKRGAFTSAFPRAYAQLVRASKASITDTRLALVAKELDQGAPTLVRSDLTHLSSADKAFVGHMMRVGDMIDVVYDLTTGAAAMAGRVPTDPLSQSLYRRNRGPTCQASATATTPLCSAVPGSPKLVADAYPAKVQRGKDFCAALQKRSDGNELLSPFTVVRESGSSLKAAPYTVVYKQQMTAIADELAAAATTEHDPFEAPLVSYLRAAAASFRTNNWEPADEAWSKMNAQNSKWYVRVGPDETLTDPCAAKAAFHFNFARINQSSLEWQTRLAPVRQDMENSLAVLAGAAYRPRTVSFHLPDFIDIIVNTGDDRFGLGVVTGESLPNWGPVADEGRGRTVVMANVTSDVDSLAARRSQAASLMDAASMTALVDSPRPDLFSNVLHEVTHNLGPLYSYTVNGKTSEAVFGGPLASMLEELKAQTGAIYYIDFLRARGVIDNTLAAQTYADSVVWALGQAANGAAAPDASPYAQLAAIQLGSLIDHGALTWDAAAHAANGTDAGAFTLHSEKLAPAIKQLMTLILAIKARGDKPAAERLVARYAHGTIVPLTTITQRWQRLSKPSMVYAVTF